MWNCSSPGGLLPEQVWDTAPIPALGLEPGRPSGSAMPLLWSHAEFLKLLVAREHGKPLELLDAVAQRYGDAERVAAAWRWREEAPVTLLLMGRDLIIEDREPFELHMGFDGWQRIQDRTATQGPFGLWSVRLTVAELAAAEVLDFTRQRRGGWEGLDHHVSLGHDAVHHALPLV
jgi:glucoamylase